MSTATKFKDASMRRIFLSSKGSFHVVKPNGKKAYAPKAHFINSPGGTSTRVIHKSSANVPLAIRLKRPGPAKGTKRAPRAHKSPVWNLPNPHLRRIFYGPRKQRATRAHKSPVWNLPNPHMRRPRRVFYGPRKQRARKVTLADIIRASV